MKRLSISFMLLLMAAIYSVAIAADAGGERHGYKAELSGAEIPPVLTKATGEATFELTVNGKSGALHYKLAVRNIENATGAHLHIGKKTTSQGPVVAPLFGGPKKSGQFSGLLAEGTITDKDLAGPLSGKTVQDLARMINAGDIYVNVHTEKHPAGEIRGQVKEQ